MRTLHGNQLINVLGDIIGDQNFGDSFQASNMLRWALDQMQQHRLALAMSSVNLAEALILGEDRQPLLFSRMREMVLSSSVRFVPPTPEQAILAAEARVRFPSNLENCLAYALPRDLGVPLLILDPDFRKTDIPVVMP